ncbi:MAG: ATPase domain-containing protein, partial [Caldivirga sp.]|uniref:ATPase domain-containing protein n=1 Tax=Caldivirga sp. TaxID=2080243 RepID=UPI003D1136B0
PIVYVTTEASFHDAAEQAKQFKIDLSTGVSLADILSGRVKEAEDLVFVDLFGLYREYRVMLKANEEGRRPVRALSIDVLRGAINEAYKALGVERGDEALVIIDSMSAFWADKPALARAFSYGLRQSLYRQNVTVLMTSQYAPTTDSTFGFGLEHVADGIIHMWMDNVQEAKEIRRWLIVKKMRLTNHDRRAHRFEITPQGIVEAPTGA